MVTRAQAQGKIIWAHTGFGLSTERVSEMLSKYPKLWGELSYRGGIVDGSGEATGSFVNIAGAGFERMLSVFASVICSENQIRFINPLPTKKLATAWWRRMTTR